MEMYKRELKNCIDNNMQKSAKRNKMILDALALLEEKMKQLSVLHALWEESMGHMQGC